MERSYKDGKGNESDRKGGRIWSRCRKSHHYRTANSNNDTKRHLDQQCIKLKELNKTNLSTLGGAREKDKERER
jgi:hypothetical protein